MPNRLAHSTSPYLLQHKDNPVDWHEWGPEAFGLARSRGVPIFLSIGYSTCYWCHVMERESFEDDETAGVLNAGFVPVKVDREQRPDVDELYMAATQILTGHGGWPMSVFIEPEALRPFWAGTYYPKEPRHGLPSFTQVLGGMSDAYANKRGDVLAQAERLAEAVAEHLAERPGPVAVGPSQVTAVVGALLQSHDRVEGGFGGAPKFPQPVYLEMLLDAREAAADDATRDAIDAALRLTLDRMALGGLFDQAGGGFHRYCVDATWTVPHFEKMLYDNAQLASVYGRAAALYGDAFYGGIVERTLWYVEREMTAPGGGLYSAQDAEVDGREGLNYLWTDEQAAGVLTEGELGVAREHYPLGEPNFTDPHHPEDGPTTVLRLAERPADPAALEGVNARLYEARQDRKQPHLDDKVLVSWNAMMISVLPPEPAARAAGFVLGQMRDEGGRLFRSWREGRADGDGVLEDYAAMISACCRLREVGAGGSDGVRDWLGEARALAEVVERDFAAGDGGYYDTRAGREDLFVRTRATYDGAIASGNALMLHALLDLHGLDPDGPWLDRAIASLRSVSGVIAAQGVASVGSTRALLRVLRLGPEVAERLAFGPSPEASSSSPDFTPVEIFADTARVAVSAGRPGTLKLVIKIAPGHHILAGDHVAPGADLGALGASLVPLRVGLVSGRGVAVYADYPEGEAYGAELVGKDELLVHTSEVELTVAVEHAPGVGASEGDPILGVTFQACTDEACLEPRTVELDVAVDLG